MSSRNPARCQHGQHYNYLRASKVASVTAEATGVRPKLWKCADGLWHVGQMKAPASGSASGGEGRISAGD